MKTPAALVVAVLIGVAVVGQARINGELGAQIHDGVAAAAVSFGTGLVLVAGFLLVNPGRRQRLMRVPAAVRDGRLRWWHCVGGVSGALAVASQGFTVTSIGVAMFTVAIVGGQVVTGIWVDRAGLGPSGVSPITRERVVGGALVVAAVVLASHGSLTKGTAWWLIVLPVVAGSAVAWQMAVNGKVAIAGGPMSSAFLNFLVGLIALAVAEVVVIAVRGLPTGFPSEPWLYAGGALGVLFVSVASYLVRVLGVLVLALATIAGQLIGALALDVVVPAGRQVTWAVAAACGLALVGVWIGRRGSARVNRDPARPLDVK